MYPEAVRYVYFESSGKQQYWTYRVGIMGIEVVLKCMKIDAIA